MFERYNTSARRAIFFARYEASQFGRRHIETEHLLLGLLREDKALANRFWPHAAIESIRKQIEAHTTIREKVSTSVDLPLTHECKRVLAYGAEEAQRLNHKYVGTPHLLLGVLREEKSFAAHLLREQGLALDSVRQDVRRLVPGALPEGELSETPLAVRGDVAIAGLDEWLAEHEANGGIWIVENETVANSTTRLAIYAIDPPKENEEGKDTDPTEKLAQIHNRIQFIVQRMEHAIANHEFERARFYSDEERKERENLRLLREQFNLEELPPHIPLLCVEVIRDDPFSDIQNRCEDYIAEGVPQVWILDPRFKRAYTVTKTEGLREFKGKILQIANPPLEMDLNKIFG